MLYLAAFSAQAAPIVDEQLVAYIEDSFRGAQVYSATTGNLGEVGSTYAALLLTKEDTEMWIAVARRTDSEGYHLVASSPHWQYEPLNRSGWDGIKIEGRSILLSDSNTGGCCSGGRRTFRFNKFQQKLSLVGVETSEYGYFGSPYEAASYKYFEGRTSVNLLSHKAIHSIRVGPPKANANELGFGGKTQYAETLLDIPKPIEADISTFRPDDYDWFVARTPSLCGAMGETMKYTKGPLCEK